MTLAYLMGDIGYDAYHKHVIKNKEYFDIVLAKSNIDTSQMEQLLDERMKDMEHVGKMIYEESVRIADEAKAANERRKSS